MNEAEIPSKVVQFDRTSLVCDYRRRPEWQASLLQGTFLGVLLSLLIVQSTTTVRSREAMIVPAILNLTLPATLLVRSRLQWLRWKHERISTFGGRIVWTSKFNRTKLDVAFEDVVYGSFALRSFVGARLYGVETKGGELTWSSKISYFRELNALMRRLAGGEDGA